MKGYKTLVTTTDLASKNIFKFDDINSRSISGYFIGMAQIQYKQKVTDYIVMKNKSGIQLVCLYRNLEKYKYMFVRGDLITITKGDDITTGSGNTMMTFDIEIQVKDMNDEN